MSKLGKPLFRKTDKPDWRLGLLVQPKYAIDSSRLPPRAVIWDVLEEYPDIHDPTGILVLRVDRTYGEGEQPIYIIDAADNWVTA